MRKNYDDPIKKIWRGRLLDFSVSALKRSGKKSTDCRILCMPGEEGYEIEHVYRPLGILDRNILAFEKSADRSRRLKRKFPDVNVIEAEVGEFLETYNEPFWLINLDYESPMTPSAGTAIQTISGRQLIDDGGVFGCTVLNRREDSLSQTLYRTHAVLSADDEFKAAVGLRAFFGLDTNPDFYKQDFYGCSFFDLKGHVFPRLVTDCLVCGKAIYELNPVFRALPERGFVEKMWHFLSTSEWGRKPLGECIQNIEDIEREMKSVVPPEGGV